MKRAVRMMRATLLAALATVAIWGVGPARADTFTVTDSSFVGDVYTFRYLTRYNQAYVNGALTPFVSLFTSNTGWERSVWVDGVTWYWQGPSGPPSAQATMAWDLTTVTRPISKVQLNVGNWLFTYDPIYHYSVGDTITGDVSSDGRATWTSMYTYVGPGNDSVGAVGLWGLDMTGFLPPAWLADPGLLDFRFSFQDFDPPLWWIHPSNVQLFRDGGPELPTITEELAAGDSFMLRITRSPDQSPKVPLPGSLWLLLLGGSAATGLGLLRRRR